jgi:hypothetical protein
MTTKKGEVEGSDKVSLEERSRGISMDGDGRRGVRLWIRMANEKWELILE